MSSLFSSRGVSSDGMSRPFLTLTSSSPGASSPRRFCPTLAPATSRPMPGPASVLTSASRARAGSLPPSALKSSNRPSRCLDELHCSAITFYVYSPQMKILSGSLRPMHLEHLWLCYSFPNNCDRQCDSGLHRLAIFEHARLSCETPGSLASRPNCLMTSLKDQFTASSDRHSLARAEAIAADRLSLSRSRPTRRRFKSNPRHMLPF